MRKNYVLDANVLLHDPHAIFKFEDNHVVIPIYAIEESDKFKRESTERGRNARTIARVLDDLRPKDGTLSEPVDIKTGGTQDGVSQTRGYGATCLWPRRVPVF